MNGLIAGQKEDDLEATRFGLNFHWGNSTPIMARIAFGLLSFVSCILELGLVIDWVIGACSLQVFVLAILAFHIANLAIYVVRPPRVIGLVSLLVGGTILVLLGKNPASLYIVGIFLSKLGVQVFRQAYKSSVHIGEIFKSFPRFLGFILACVYSPLIVGVLLLSCFLLALFVRETKVEREIHQPLVDKISNNVYATISTHSMHYFAFGYAIPFIFFNYFSSPLYFLGVVYLLGWIGYYLIDKITSPSPNAMRWGHIVSAVAIAVLFFSHSAVLAIIAWIATGFGGGTIFILPKLRDSNKYDQRKYDIWDNSSNIVGLLIFTLSFRFHSLGLSFVVAAILALASAYFASTLNPVSRNK